MALKLGSLKGTFLVIISADPSLAEDLSKDEYKAYLESFKDGKGNEQLLRFKPLAEGQLEDTTRFVVSRSMPYDKTIELKDMQTKVSKGDLELKTGYILEEVRCSLVGIKSPEHVPEDERIAFVKDSDGFASKDMIQAMDQRGWVMDLWAARNAATSSASTAGIKKK